MENITIQFIFMLALSNIAYYNSDSQWDSVIKTNAEEKLTNGLKQRADLMEVEKRFKPKKKSLSSFIEM